MSQPDYNWSRISSTAATSTNALSKTGPALFHTASIGTIATTGAQVLIYDGVSSATSTSVATPNTLFAILPSSQVGSWTYDAVFTVGLFVSSCTTGTGPDLTWTWA